MTAIIGAALQILGTLSQIFLKSYEAHQSAPMVLAAMQKFHQDLKDKQVEIDKLAANPNATPAQHQAALDSIRLSAS